MKETWNKYAKPACGAVAFFGLLWAARQWAEARHAARVAGNYGLVTRGQERDGRWHWQLARWLMAEGCHDAADAEFGRALAEAPADADAIRADAVENRERRDGVLPRPATTLAPNGPTTLTPGRAAELRPNPPAGGR